MTTIPVVYVKGPMIILRQFPLQPITEELMTESYHR